MNDNIISETYDSMFSAKTFPNIKNIKEDDIRKEMEDERDEYYKIKQSPPEKFVQMLKGYINEVNEILKAAKSNVCKDRLIRGLDYYKELSSLVSVENDVISVNWDLIKDSSVAIFVVYMMITNGGPISDEYSPWKCV